MVVGLVILRRGQRTTSFMVLPHHKSCFLIASSVYDPLELDVGVKAKGGIIHFTRNCFTLPTRNPLSGKLLATNPAWI
jgi:hypothetical protein